MYSVFSSNINLCKEFKPLDRVYHNKIQQDNFSGVHSACREENEQKVGIYVQLHTQGKT